MFAQPKKIKEGEKRKEGKKKFVILRRTEFYKLFEAGILNNSLDATSSSKAVWKNNSFYCPYSEYKRKCVTTPDLDGTNVVLLKSPTSGSLKSKSVL